MDEAERYGSHIFEKKNQRKNSQLCWIKERWKALQGEKNRDKIREKVIRAKEDEREGQNLWENGEERRKNEIKGMIQTKQRCNKH